MNNREDEFQEIYRAYQPKIHRYLVNLVDEHEADDLTQEVFIKVDHGLDDFRGESSLSTWIYRIATNVAMDRLRSPSFRRGSKDKSIEAGEAEISDKNAWTGEKTPLVEQQLYRKEMSECIHDFIGELPENYRPVLVLIELEGLSNHKVAEILGVSQGTVKIRLHRAREKLRNMLMSGCDSYWVEGNEFVPDLKDYLQEVYKN